MSTASRYRVARPGQPSREMTLEEINQAVAAGALSPEDTYWREGMPKWEPLRALSGLIFSGAAAGGAPTPTKTGAAAAEAPRDKSWEAANSFWGGATPYALPTIWNPSGILGLSLFISPVVGAALVGRNAKAAGKPEGSFGATAWLWITATVMIFLAFAPLSATTVGVAWWLLPAVYLVLWLGFTLACAWPHQRWVASEIGPRSRSATWAAPIWWSVLGWTVWTATFWSLWHFTPARLP